MFSPTDPHIHSFGMAHASQECARMRLVMASQWPDSPAGRLLKKIETHYGTPKLSVLAGPFEMILWEIVAYLSDDNRRGMAFDLLRKKVGLTPAQILAAPLKTLRAITREGGAGFRQGTFPVYNNPSSIVVGNWVDGNNATHGFVRIP